MNILICDDSGMARKQMVRALPEHLTDNIQFAEHGQQALDKLTTEHFDLLLLDLTMPVMDGYETLHQVQQRKIDCFTIVVSGDIQPEAKQRVLKLGALAFLQKPVDPDQLQQLLSDYGLISAAALAQISPSSKDQSDTVLTHLSPESPKDCLREVANVAMGQAASKLAQLLGAFINLPIPRVDLLSRGELAMTLAALAGGQHFAVCQGFSGRGLAAEAILSTDQRGRDGLVKLMLNHNANTGDAGIGAVLDAAAILTGAFLTGMGKALDMDFSKSQPVFLSANDYTALDWDTRIQNIDDTLTIEIPYHFEQEDFVCDLLLLFPGKTGDYILERASLLMDDEG